MIEITLYNIEEAAQLLKVTPRTILQYIYDNKIPAQKIGRRWQIKEEDLKAYLNIK